MTRKALGRGLSALLRETETASPPSAGIESVPINEIEPNPFQPRRAFPEASLKELAESIRATGLVQPVLVRKVQDQYQLVVGERRWRASKMAGLEAIPATVRDLSDREALELALTENLLREDLNPMEAAHGLKSLQDTYGLRHEEIAERLGMDRSTVTNTIRLLRLPADIQAMISRGELTAGHGRALLGLATEGEQLKAATFVLKHALSVRGTEDFVARRASPLPSRKPQPEEERDPNVRAAERELEQTLGTHVKILGDGKRGHIEIRYYSAEDLNRLFDWIVRR
jgi:ParB family chromosome partitioning protein